MNYYSSAFPVLASTDGVAYEIYLSGCKGHCPGCHSVWTHDFDAGQEITDDFLEKLLSSIREGEHIIDNIAVLGGEPLDQDIDELVNFLKVLSDEFPDKGIWLYTSYEYEDVPDKVLDLVNVVKCGKYDKDKVDPAGRGFTDPEFLVTLVSSNQYFKRGRREIKKSIPPLYRRYIIPEKLLDQIGITNNSYSIIKDYINDSIVISKVRDNHYLELFHNDKRVLGLPIDYSTYMKLRRYSHRRSEKYRSDAKVGDRVAYVDEYENELVKMYIITVYFDSQNDMRNFSDFDDYREVTDLSEFSDYNIITHKKLK